MSDQATRNHRLILPVAVTLTLVLAVYAGMYYGMVKPHSRLGETHAFYGEWIPARLYVTQLRFHRRVEILFRPIHWLDRRLRPEVWGAVELPP